MKGSIGKQNVGKVKGKEPKAAAIGVGKADINMPAVKRQPKPPPTKAAPKGRGPAPSAPSAPSKPAGHVGAKAGSVNLVPKRSRSVKKIHLKPRADAMRSNPPLGRRWTAYPRRRRGTTKQKAPTQGPKHADPRGTDGDGPRGEAPEAGRGGEIVCPAPGTPREPQPVRSPVPASGPEHSGRTSRRHHPCGAGDYRQDQLYKSDADSSSAPASSSAANWGDGGTWGDSSAGVTQQFLHGDRTRGAEDARTRGAEDTRTRGTEDARCGDSSPGDARSIHAAENDFERQQEGKGLGGATGEGAGFARSGANGYDVGFATGVSSSDQVGRANNGQGGSNSEGQDVFPGRPPASSWGVLGRSLREGGAPRSMCRGFHQPSSTCSLNGGQCKLSSSLRPLPPEIARILQRLSKVWPQGLRG